MRLTFTVLACCLAFLQPAFADPITASRLRPAADDADAYLVDGHYLRGEKALAGMRSRGELPDLIPDGRCQFALAGDPDGAYYVRNCPE